MRVCICVLRSACGMPPSVWDQMWRKQCTQLAVIISTPPLVVKSGTSILNSAGRNPVFSHDELCHTDLVKVTQSSVVV